MVTLTNKEIGEGSVTASLILSTYVTEAELWYHLQLLRPQGAFRLENKMGGSVSLKPNHPNGQNEGLITYCTGDWLAKFGFVPACSDNKLKLSS